MCPLNQNRRKFGPQESQKQLYGFLKDDGRPAPRIIGVTIIHGKTSYKILQDLTKCKKIPQDHVTESWKIVSWKILQHLAQHFTRYRLCP